MVLPPPQRYMAQQVQAKEGCNAALWQIYSLDTPSYFSLLTGLKDGEMTWIRRLTALSALVPLVL